MNDTTFENYQKRMLDAIKNSNEQSNDPFTKLSNILENLKLFVNTGIYSQAEFKQEVEKQFKKEHFSFKVKNKNSNQVFARLEFFFAFTSKFSQYIMD